MWKPASISVAGEGRIVGQVYYTVRASREMGISGIPYYVIRLEDGTHACAYRVHQDDAQIGGRLLISDCCTYPPPIDAALRCLRTGKAVRIGQFDSIRPHTR
jgi:hypothetical protein